MSPVSLYLRKSSGSPDGQLARFGCCIVDYFGFSHVGHGRVGLEYRNNQMVLFGLEPQDQEGGVLLRHFWRCPVQHLASADYEAIPKQVKDKGVAIGVAILLTSSDNHVLLTRRAEHMRTFPGVWVPPGGHVEAGESLNEAVLRELKEETGISITAQPTILGLWESIYPHKLELGQPQRQHIIAYLCVRSQFTWKQLGLQLKLDPDETDAAMWLPTSIVEKMSKGVSREEFPSHVSVYINSAVGKTTEIQLESDTVIANSAPSPNSTEADIEHSIGGTRFSLQLWLQWVHGSSWSKL